MNKNLERILHNRINLLEVTWELIRWEITVYETKNISSDENGEEKIEQWTTYGKQKRRIKRVDKNGLGGLFFEECKTKQLEDKEALGKTKGWY